MSDSSSDVEFQKMTESTHSVPNKRPRSDSVEIYRIRDKGQEFQESLERCTAPCPKRQVPVPPPPSLLDGLRKKIHSRQRRGIQVSQSSESPKKVSAVSIWSSSSSHRPSHRQPSTPSEFPIRNGRVLTKRVDASSAQKSKATTRVQSPSKSLEMRNALKTAAIEIYQIHENLDERLHLFKGEWQKFCKGVGQHDMSADRLIFKAVEHAIGTLLTSVDDPRVGAFEKAQEAHTLDSLIHSINVLVEQSEWYCQEEYGNDVTPLTIVNNMFEEYLPLHQELTNTTHGIISEVQFKFMMIFS